MAIEQLSDFLTDKRFLTDGHAMPEADRAAIWGLLAGAMKANFLYEKGVTTVAKYLAPFEYMLAQSARRNGGFVVLQQFLSGTRREFPFGTVEVDSSGRITFLAVVPPFPDPNPLTSKATVVRP